MATPTYTLIDSQLLSSTSTNITFTSIPQSYADLVLVCESSASTGSVYHYIRFNNDTGSNYKRVYMQARSGAQDGGVFTQTYIEGNNGAAGTSDRNYTICDIMDYSRTDKQKTVLISNSDDQAARIVEAAATWANNSAITEIDIFQGTYAVGSRFSLYGIVS